MSLLSNQIGEVFLFPSHVVHEVFHGTNMSIVHELKDGTESEVENIKMRSSILVRFVQEQ